MDISKRSLLAGSAAVLATGAAIDQAAARQPNMEDALTHLRAAKHSLEAANANKGGHRKKAIQLVDEAMSQVRKGIKHAGA